VNELIRRLVVGSISLVLLAIFIYFAPIGWFRPILALAVAAVACVALWEYYQLCIAKKFHPPTVFGIASAIFILFVRFLQSQAVLAPELATWAVGLVIFILFCDLLPRQNHAIANLATSTFGIFYTVIPLSLTFDILYAFPNGQWWLTLAIAVTVGTDAAGYFVGKLMGRHPIAPKLSPKKTVEGTLGGVLAATLIAWTWYALAPHDTTLVHTLIMGFLLGIVGQVGDLAESLLKRDAKVKDSNRLPGLGGVLDTVDSLLFNLPLVYIFLKGVSF